MKNDKEIMMTIPKIFTGDNCVQITFSFKKNFTLFSTNFKEEGFLCHYNINNLDENINKYINDERRINFPYYNIPFFRGLNGKYFVNQLLEFNKNYYMISNGNITNIYIVKNNEKATIISKNIAMPFDTIRKQVSNGKTYCGIDCLAAIDFNGKIYGLLSNASQAVKDFVLNGGGFLLKDENDGIKVDIVLINQGYNPYYFYVLETEVPRLEYNNLKLNSEDKIKELRIHNVNPILNPNIDKNMIKKEKNRVKKLNKNR